MSVNLRAKSRRTRKNNIRHSIKNNTIQKISNVYYLKNEQMQGSLSPRSSTNLSSTCIQTCKNLFKKYVSEHVKSVSDVITNELLKYNTLSLIDFIKMNYNKKYAEIFCEHFKNNKCVKSYIDTLMPRLEDFEINLSNLKYSEEDKPNFTVKSVNNLLDKINNVYASFYNSKGGSPTNTGEEDDEDEDEDICIICFENLIQNNRTIIHPVNCLHQMHSNCARRWWRTQIRNGIHNPRCPLCNIESNLPQETAQEIPQTQLLLDEPVEPLPLLTMRRFLNIRTRRIIQYLLAFGAYIAYRWDFLFNSEYAGELQFFNGSPLCSPLFLLFIFILVSAT